MSTMKEAFDDIYRNDRWGNGSGPGSDPAQARPFLDYLNTVTGAKFVNSFLDVGCGDGQLVSSGRFDPAFMHGYIGVDVSEEALKRFRSRTHLPCVQMNASDAVWRFDFALIKDVLQHLPNMECLRLLQAVSQCKTVWVINDRPDVVELTECEAGGYRPIDPRMLVPEFRIRGQYQIAGFHKVLWEWSPPSGNAPTGRQA